ncbi:MAG: hypothetical protein AB8H79_09560, partial [Myxococcota bacterium]
GAKVRGAEIKDAHVVLPKGLPSGTSLTFEQDIKQSTSIFAPSGAFRTVPGLATARAELVIRSVKGPLGVWADPAGAPTWSEGGSPQAILVWNDVPTDAQAEAVWSTGTTWQRAGDALNAQVDATLTTRLGRSLGEGLKTATPASLAERVYAGVSLVEPTGPGWESRPAAEVIAGGSGTPAERGAVLISALRAAGYQAYPGLYRPSRLPGTVPTSLPAPSQLSRPVVAVSMDEGTMWIDPAASAVVPPTLPFDLTGATAWVAGDLPRRLQSSGATEGSVPISGQISLESGGGESFVLNLSATGTADEWLRSQLVGMSDAERATLMSDLIRPGRPELDRLTVTVTGEEDRSKDLRVTVRGHTKPRLKELSPGLITESVPAVLATGLATWLPEKIAVREELALTPPPGHALFAVLTPPVPSHPGAVVTAKVRREADKILLVADVERPIQYDSPEAASRALRSLNSARRTGPTVIYSSEVSARAAKGLKAADLDPADRITLEAMMWWRVAKYGKARKLLARYVDIVGLDELNTSLGAYNAPYDLRRTLVDVPRNSRDKLASLPILVESGREHDAWMRAVEVSDSKSPDHQVSSRLWMLKLQPTEPPDPTKDPQGALLWQEPEQLIRDADRIAKASRDGAPDPKVLAVQAARAAAQGDSEAATELLRKATAQSNDPELWIAFATASAAAGAPMDDVQARLDRAVSQRPSDGVLLAQVAATFAATGHRVDALNRSLGAARVSGGDADVWAGVVQRALEAGELGTALFAARRASDLALSNKAHASVLTRVATLAGDPEQANLGWTRGGDPLEVSWPPVIEELTALVEPPHLLAVLRHHDAAVVSDPGLLSLRAQLELQGGDRARAVRDGALLSQRHGLARGRVVAFGAGLGSTWTSSDDTTLDTLARLDPSARATRLELRALFGGSVSADVRAMDDDPRAKLWKMALKDPAGLAAKDPTWKSPPVTWGSPPQGYRVNSVLGTVEGVEAWSAPDSRRTVVRHGAEGPIPPPLSVLYTPRNPPVRSLPDEGRILVLDDGSFPVYAAARREQQSWVVGLGLSPEEAERALAAAPPL